MAWPPKDGQKKYNTATRQQQSISDLGLGAYLTLLQTSWSSTMMLILYSISCCCSCLEITFCAVIFRVQTYFMSCLDPFFFPALIQFCTPFFIIVLCSGFFSIFFLFQSRPRPFSTDDSKITFEDDQRGLE